MDEEGFAQKDLRDLSVVFGKSSANMMLEEGV